MKFRLWLGVGLVVLLVVSVTIFFFLQSSSGKNDSGEYYDPNSKETISNPQDKTPELSEEQSKTIFLGFSSLYDHGLSQDQIENLKQAFEQYQKASGNKIKEVSVAVDTVKYIPFNKQSTDTTAYITFDVVFDRTQKRKAKVAFNDITAIRLLLSDSSGKQIYDSGRVERPSQELH